MKRLTKFAYADGPNDSELHLDVPAMLAELGVADTEENRDKMVAIAAEHLAQLLPNKPIIITKKPAKRRDDNGS